MKVVVDDKIPFIRGILEQFADVHYLKGSDICKEDLIAADALIIRTRTVVNRELLSGTSVKFVGSTTIGTDHVDVNWCAENKVKFVSAPGCNSGSVTQYIASALAMLQQELNYKQDAVTLGIIGVGNVGAKVASLAHALGYKVLLNDPPRSRAEGSDIFVPLQELIKNSDIITIHVPLIMEGQDRTLRFINSSILKHTKKGAILINTSRGDVLDETDIIKLRKSDHMGQIVIDVWENEPAINMELLRLSFIATPHIAGYSLDGKLNGTSTILKQLSDFFNIKPDFRTNDYLPDPDNKVLNLNRSGEETSSLVNNSILQTYPILEDHNLLLKEPSDFEKLRDNYRSRREFHAYETSGDNFEAINILRKIGFR